MLRFFIHCFCQIHFNLPVVNSSLEIPKENNYPWKGGNKRSHNQHSFWLLAILASALVIPKFGF